MAVSTVSPPAPAAGRSRGHHHLPDEATDESFVLSEEDGEEDLEEEDDEEEGSVEGDSLPATPPTRQQPQEPQMKQAAVARNVPPSVVVDSSAVQASVSASSVTTQPLRFVVLACLEFGLGSALHLDCVAGPVLPVVACFDVCRATQIVEFRFMCAGLAV